jgi:uncharacterized repeat protein (TIGR02543 family)
MFLRYRTYLPMIMSIALLASALSVGGVVSNVTVLKVGAVTPPPMADPTLIWKEDFENFGVSPNPNGDGVAPVMLRTSTSAYVGKYGDIETTYTADPQWLDSSVCNGIIVSDQAADAPFEECFRNNASPPVLIDTQMKALKSLAKAIGGKNGSAAPEKNHAVAAYTAVYSPSTVAPGILAQTATPITFNSIGNRYISASIWAAEICYTQRASLRFSYSLDGTNWTALGDRARVCSSGAGFGTTQVVQPFAPQGQLMPAGDSTSIYLKMENLSTGGADGIDFAWDDLALYDATPTLTKAFNPETLDLAANPNTVSKLSFTVTNTTEYGEKYGWSFIDTLPAGLVIASTPNPIVAKGLYGKCSATVTAVAGTNTIEVTNGKLEFDGSTFVDKCTISVDVTGVATGTFINYLSGAGVTNVSSVVGLIATDSASLTISSLPPTLQYDANGGSGTMATVTAASGSNVTLSVNEFSNSTAFLGWSTSPGGAVAYQPGDQITMPADGLTLYAIWEPPPPPQPPPQIWTLTYVATGGTCAAPSQTALDGTQVVTYGDTSCSRVGYVFAGWNTLINGTGLEILPGSAIVLTSNNTLYAQWIPIKVEASADVNATLVNSPVSGSVTTNDDVPEKAKFDLASAPANGSVVLNSDGTYTYTPAAGFVGIDSFTYTVCDAGGLPCATATVQITVAGADGMQVFTPLDELISNTVASPGLAPSGSIYSILTAPANGTLVLRPDGSYTYTPNLGFIGTDTFTFQVCIPSGEACPIGTATVTVVDGPIIKARPELKTVSANSVNSVSFAPRTSTKDGLISISNNGASVWGQIVVVPGKGTWVIKGKKAIFTPDARFYGRTSIQYRVINKTGAIALSTFTAVRIAMPGLIEGGR